MNTSVPRLTLVARDGARLPTCEVQESTHQPGQAPSWEVCGQTPAQLDPEGTFLCPVHFRRLAQCGGCGTVGGQGLTLTWHATADCMLCGACWFEDNEGTSA